MVFFAVPVAGASLALIVVWLILAATIFTVYMGFLDVRGLTHAIDLVRGRFSDPDDAGEVSHFQAVTGGEGSSFADYDWVIGVAIAAVITGGSSPSPGSPRSSCRAWPRSTSSRA